MIEVMLGVIVVVALLSLYARDLITAVILSSVASLLSCLVFILLKAPDVALTEAAVGAGVSALVFVWVIHRTERYDET
jgi:energy-converting hydrogenase B subunit D